MVDSDDLWKFIDIMDVLMQMEQHSCLHWQLISMWQKLWPCFCAEPRIIMVFRNHKVTLKSANVSFSGHCKLYAARLGRLRATACWCWGEKRLFPTYLVLYGVCMAFWKVQGACYLPLQGAGLRWQAMVVLGRMGGQARCSVLAIQGSKCCEVGPATLPVLWTA